MLRVWAKAAAGLSLGLLVVLGLWGCKEEAHFKPVATADAGPSLPPDLAIVDLPPPSLAYGRFICAERQACRYAVVPSKDLARQRVVILTAPGQVLEQSFPLIQRLSQAQTEVWVLELPGLGDAKSLNPGLTAILETAPQPSLTSDLKSWASALRVLLGHARSDSPDLPTLILAPESVSTALLAFGLPEKTQLLLVYPDPKSSAEDAVYRAYKGVNPNLGRGLGLDVLKARLEKTRLDLVMGGNVFSDYPPIFFVTLLPAPWTSDSAQNPVSETPNAIDHPRCPIRANCEEIKISFEGNTSYLTADYMIATLVAGLKKRPDIAAQALLDMIPEGQSLEDPKIVFEVKKE